MRLLPFVQVWVLEFERGLPTASLKRICCNSLSLFFGLPMKEAFPRFISDSACSVYNKKKYLRRPKVPPRRSNGELDRVIVKTPIGTKKWLYPECNECKRRRRHPYDLNDLSWSVTLEKKEREPFFGLWTILVGQPPKKKLAKEELEPLNN